MRITGGQARGRHLASPKGLNIRPTSDQVREAIYNIIGQDLSGLKGLDLFAGTGSLGLEALSRGARQVAFIDNSQKAINLIKKNLALVGHLSSGAFLRKDLRKGIPWNHPLLKEKFDLVFIDPPYGEGLIPALIEELGAKDVLASRVRVVVESSNKDSLPNCSGNLEMVNNRSYGDTKITIYANRAES